MKRRVAYFVLLFFVFASGVLGHLLLRPVAPAEQSYTLTLKTDALPTLLVYGLPAVGEGVSLAGHSATLLSCTAEPTTLFYRREGELLSRPSTLTVRLSLTVRLAAHEKDARLFLGTQGISVGEDLPLTGQNFAVSARFLAYEPSF